jgi:hypothetical protein
MSQEPSAAELRRQVEEAAMGLCEYCRCPSSCSPAPFAVEHILPKSSGGLGERDNLAFACAGCNGHKFIATTAEDPLTGESAPIFHPRKHSWDDHFAWSVDTLHIIGLTPIGRATVERLQLNREGVRELRRILRDAGMHPPG